LFFLVSAHTFKVLAVPNIALGTSTTTDNTFEPAKVSHLVLNVAVPPRIA
jgi:hypothetical protein